MLRVRISSCVGVLLCLLVAGCQSQNKITLSNDPIGGEELKVYQGLVSGLSKLDFKSIANRTIPFNFDGFPEGGPCLKGIDLQDAGAAAHISHPLGEALVSGASRKLTEIGALPQSRRWLQSETSARPTKSENNDSNQKVFVLSEIVFDKQHEFAVVKYFLVCGEHCISGAALVMQKTGDKWAFSDRRPCAMFVGG